MQIREILKAKKEPVSTVNRKEVLGKKQFNGNFIVTKPIKKNKKEGEKSISLRSAQRV